MDDWTAQKNVVQPGSKEAGVLNQSINEIPYTPTGEGLQGALNSGRVYTYEQRFGGAEFYSKQGNIFVPTRSLAFDPSYIGYQLSHEYFHVLSYQFAGWRGFEGYANAFAAGSNLRSTIIEYPTAQRLYLGVLEGAFSP